MDAPADTVTAQADEDRETLPAHGGLYDAADLVYGTARPRHRGRPCERQLRALLQLFVHSWSGRQGDRDRGVGDVPSDLGGDVDLDEVARSL